MIVHKVSDTQGNIITYVAKIVRNGRVIVCTTNASRYLAIANALLRLEIMQLGNKMRM